jgi:GNAT superfamily N-acetyltransferase
MRKVDRKHGRDCYPCHLHINLDERYRNRGIGSALIAAFAVQAASAGRSGIHVVTGERARNVRFYEKNEFRPLATAHWNGVDVVFMGRLLRPPLTQRHFDKET